MRGSALDIACDITIRTVQIVRPRREDRRMDQYTFRAEWSPETTEYVGMCLEFPSRYSRAPLLMRQSPVSSRRSRKRFARCWPRTGRRLHH